MLRAASIACFLALVSAQDPASLLGSSLNGSSVALSPFDVRILTNQTHALWTLSFSAKTSLQSIGWAALGLGDAMTDMDAYVLWPNSTGGWTISHRTASAHIMPTVPSGDSSSSLAAAGVEIVSTSPLNASAGPTVSFIRPLKLSTTSYITDRNDERDMASGEQDLVYAFSANRPPSDAYDATLTIHRDNGAIVVDLSSPFAIPSASASAAAVSSTSVVTVTASVLPAATTAAVQQPWTDYDRFVITHAALGCAAWLLFAPLAILVARFGRVLSIWLSLHRGVQSVTAALTVAAFGLGVEAVQLNDRSHFNDAHKVIGLLILVFLIMQVGLGLLAHALFNSERTRRPFRNVAHWSLGIVTAILAFVQIYLGFREYERLGGHSTPTSVVVVVSVLVGLTSLAYLVGLTVLASQAFGSDRNQQLTAVESNEAAGTIKAEEGSNKDIDAEVGSEGSMGQ